MNYNDAILSRSIAFINDMKLHNIQVRFSVDFLSALHRNSIIQDLAIKVVQSSDSNSVYYIHSLGHYKLSANFAVSET